MKSAGALTRDHFERSGLEDPRVFAALEEYQSLVAANRRPDRAEFLGRHASIAEMLARCLDAFEFVQGAAEGPGTNAPGPRGELRPNAVLGDFRVVREVGRGGMGVVLEAVQLSLGRRVALKVLPLGKGVDERQLQRFRNEVQAAASLNHPHIVPIHAVDCVDGIHFYAMQFIDGCSLATALSELSSGRASSRPSARLTANDTTTDHIDNAPAETGAPPAAPKAAPADAWPSKTAPGTTAYYREIGRLIEQAARALHHAHLVGVIHRDVKPGNLLLDRLGAVWVADFGLAKLPGSDLTMTGDVVGTLRYMSPEQALGKTLGLDHRADVYSLGATLYELLTLRPAFSGEDRQAILNQITGSEPRPARQVEATVPEDLETIALKALAKEPAERYATAEEFADDLRRYLDDQPIQARRPGIVLKARKWARRHRRALTAIAVAAFFVLAAAVTGLLIATDRIREEQQHTQKANEDLAKSGTRLKEANTELHGKNQQLDAALLKARRAEYTYRFLVARAEALAGNLPRLAEVLGDCPEEHRSWEWNYLMQQTTPGIWSLPSAYDFSFSRDGRHLAVVRAKTLGVWDISPGRGPAALPRWTVELAETGRKPTFTADGKNVAVFAGTKLRTHATADGKETRAPEIAGVPWLLSPAADRIVCSDDKNWWLADASDGRPLPGFTPMPHHAMVIPKSGPFGDPRGTRIYPGFAFSACGKWVAMNTKDGVVINDAVTGATKVTLADSRVSGNTVVFSPDGRYLARTARGLVLVWEVATSRLVQTLPVGADGLAFAPDGRRLATAHGGGVIIWDASTGSRLVTIPDQTASARLSHSLTFLPDGLQVAKLNARGAIVAWDSTASPEGPMMVTPNWFAAPGAAFSRDQSSLILAGIALRVTSRPDGAVFRLADAAMTPIANPDADAFLLPVRGADGRLLVHKAKTGYWLQNPDGGRRVVLGNPFGTSAATEALMSPDGKSVVVLARSPLGPKLITPPRVGWIVDASSGAARFTLCEPKGGVVDVAFDPRGEQVAVVLGKEVQIRDVLTGANLRTLSTAAFGAAYHPSGKILATLASGKCHLWDAHNGVLLRTLSLEKGASAAVAFTPDGRRLVVFREESIDFLEPESGTALLSLPAPGSQGQWKRLLFSPDGRFLVAHGFAGPILAWDGGAASAEQKLAWLRYRSIAWSETLAPTYEREKDWAAAAWHLERLTTLEPGIRSYATRLQKAREALAAPPMP